MAYKDYSNNAEEGADGLAYDLRQIYAKNVGYVIEQIADAIEQRDWPRWFHLMDNNLYVEIYQKFDKDDEEAYNKELENCVKTINQYPSAYNKQDSTPLHIWKINSALKKLYCLMRKIMEDHKMFGEKMWEDEEGL